jgi:amino acid transporter/nucleotide-binding universal stress UspA family protein
MNDRVFSEENESSRMIGGRTRRPRNVDSPRAAAILYGDWGTSKAYVLGLAFAQAGYSSFWLIAAMSVLLAVVGINYITICRHYPDGGGVYASVHHRSRTIAIIGAFLLIADYLVTAAISALSAFQYLGMPDPELFAGVAILVIGGLNYFGPKHSGELAIAFSIPTVIVVCMLGLFCLQHVGEAWHHLRPLEGGFWKNWNDFVGIVLALSGVEAIANSAGVMKLDPGSTEARPSVAKTATTAIISVVAEVTPFTALLGLGMHALAGLEVDRGQVNAPGHPGVRDQMLRYMAEVFTGEQFGPAAGDAAGLIVATVFALLLFSAVNTAIVDLTAILFLMSRDGEMPRHFQILNNFGVPNLGLIVATIIPALMVVAIPDVAGLGDLYAVGVVGAIATNLGATSTDTKLDLLLWERILMFCTFIIMLAIELSLFVDKSGARLFAGTIVAVGLLMHAIQRIGQKRAPLAAAEKRKPTQPPQSRPEFPKRAVSGSPIVCAVRGCGRTVEFAIEIAKGLDQPVYVLFVREQPILNLEDFNRDWRDDHEARRIFEYAKEKGYGHPTLPCYVVSDSTATTIVEFAAGVGASHLVLGASRRNMVLNLIRGNLIHRISRDLPETIRLIVYASDVL